MRATIVKWALATLAASTLAACQGYLEDYEAPKLKEQQYPVEANASSECISAAKRANRFCIGRKSMMDADSHADCNDARWDYHRYCR